MSLRNYVDTKHLPWKKIKKCIQNGDDPNIMSRGQPLFWKVIRYNKHWDYIRFFINRRTIISNDFLQWLYNEDNICGYIKIKVVFQFIQNMYFDKKQLSYKKYKLANEINYKHYGNCKYLKGHYEMYKKFINEYTNHKYDSHYIFLMCWNRGRNIEDNILYYMPRDIMKIIYYKILILS